MSPRLGTAGYFSARTLEGNGAISENQSKWTPKGPQATDAASMPEQTLPTVVIKGTPPPPFRWDTSSYFRR